MATLAEIRAKLASMEQKNNNDYSKDNALFPFWNMEMGQESTVRFLPDGDTNNTFFWVEKRMIKLEFPGIKGGDERKPVFMSVPCGEMYGDACPILSEVRDWFKDPALEEQGRKYWAKRTYIFQGFVKSTQLKEENVANPIRRFVITPKLFGIIKSVLMDPEVENLPIDFDNGLDFKIVKTQSGQYADYTTSKWARKESALSDNELNMVEEHGLSNLIDFIPNRPSADHYQAIAEMFHASVDGELYDPQRWAQYYKPFGVDTAPDAAGTTTTTKTFAAVKLSRPNAATDIEDTDIPFDADPVPATRAPVSTTSTSQAEPPKKSADDILAMIRNRNKA